MARALRGQAAGVCAQPSQLEMPPQLLAVAGLAKQYERSARPVHALRAVTFDVKRGEFVAVMGASGSGKTTLLQLLAGLEKPTAGSICVGGAFLHAYSEEALARYRQSVVGYAFQFFNLMPGLSVLENVALPLIIARTPRLQALERAREMLELVHMQKFQDADLGSLSGGELQRLALARALVHRPALLLADEPTASLDTLEAERLLALLIRLKKVQGLSILMATHNARVAAHAERILTLKAGRLKAPQEGLVA